MDKNFLLKIIHNKPSLFNAIVEFNVKLLNEVLDQVTYEMNELAENIVGFNKEMTNQLALCAVGLKKDQLDKLTYGFWDFSEEAQRLVFLDAETIDKIQLVFGTAVHADTLSKTLIRSDVLQLEEVLGKDIYQYGLLRGRYQLGTVKQYFLTRDRTLPLPLRIQWHGRLALKICMSDWPQDLQIKFSRQLKNLSIPYEELEEVPEEFSLAAVQGVWFAFKKILLREVAPQWTPYFD